MREAQDTNQEVGVCVHHHLCQQPGGCATVQGRWGLTHPQAAILTTDLSDGEACVLSASGPGKVSVSFRRSEKAVVDQGAIVSSDTVRVSFSGGQTRYNPPVQQQVMISFPFLSHAMQRQSSRILVF